MTEKPSIPRIIIDAALAAWKSKTNGHISVHLPDISLDSNLDEILGFVEKWLGRGASQFTIHVPKVSIKTLAVPENMEKIVDMYSTVIAATQGAVIGIENMHTKPGEPLEDRRFGYIPSECGRSRKVHKRDNGIGKELCNFTMTTPKYCGIIFRRLVI